MQTTIDPTQLIHLKIAREEFVEGKDWRHRIQFEPLDDKQPASQAAYTATRAKGLTLTESVRRAFTWELPGGTIQIESRDKGKRYGWLNGQMLFEARCSWRSPSEFTVGSETLPIEIFSPGGLLSLDAQRTLRVSGKDVLRGQVYPIPAKPLVHEVYPHWSQLSEDQQLAFLAFWLFSLLETAFQANTSSCG